MRSPVLFFIGAALAAKDECRRSYHRVVLVQDTNEAMGSMIPMLHDQYFDIAVSIMNMSSKRLAMGLVEFSDKPLPYSGWGGHVNALGGKDKDTCYNRLVGLTDEPTLVYEALEELEPRLGGDPEGSQLEALLYASQDTRMHFWHDTEYYAKHRIVRDLVLFTDQIPHETGDAKDSIEAFNGPAFYNGGSVVPTQKVGFGSQMMYKMDAATVLVNGTAPYTAVNYDAFAKLEWKRTHSKLGALEKLLYEKHLSIFGPRKYDATISDHDGKASDPGQPEADCKKKDYPTWEAFGSEMRKHNMSVTVIVHETGTRASRRLIDYCPEYPSDKSTKFNKASDRAKCVKKYWEDHLAQLGLSHYRVELKGDGKYAGIIAGSLKEHQEIECEKDQPPTTTTTTTTKPTTTTTTTKKPTTTTTTTKPTTTSKTRRPPPTRGSTIPPQ